MKKQTLIDRSDLDTRPLFAPYTLITGVTGLLGQYLIKDLMLQGQRLAVVVRPDRRSTANERLESIMLRWEQELDQCLPRPAVLQGDVSVDGLGLSTADQSWIRNHCDRVIHSAAVLQFHGASRDGEPWTTNLQGTRNVIELATHSGIRQFHYISTAYVCGLSDGPVYETDFDRGQDFRNDYERSKFEAEKLVRESTCFSSKTIYRPAVIIGDSETGFTSSYHGLFLYLRAVATLVPEQLADSRGVRHTPLKLPISGDEPRNLVPVDWVSKVICRILCNPEAHDRTYHLVPDTFATFRQVIDYCCKYFNSTGVEFDASRCEPKRDSDSAFAGRFLENVRIYQAYETSDPLFDNSNVKSVCGDLICPEVNQQMIYRFLDFGIRDKWGKRRPERPDHSPWIDRHLTNIRKAAGEICLAISRPDGIRFGIDVVGPGGGQWLFSIGRDSEVVFCSGLPSSENLVLKIGPDGMGNDNSGDSHADLVADWVEKLCPIFGAQRLIEGRYQLNG